MAYQNIKAVKISSTAPPQSKLCYTDDVLLLCNARIDELATIKRCIERYCEWSGKEISLEKSGVFPSKGVSWQYLNQVRSRWGLKKLSQNTKYLGVPLFLSENRSKDLAHIKERMENRLSGWESKNLSSARRATLIKSIAQAIPTYVMSTIQCPKSLCDKMDAAVRRFWWRPQAEGSHFFSPLAWSSVCWPQKDGGLGFRMFWDFNQAFLSKLAWWILTSKECPCIKLLSKIQGESLRGNWLCHSSAGNSSPVLEKYRGN